MKNIRLFLLAWVISASLVPPGTASAHVLQADGDIGAILHIYPDDNPISGRPLQYLLSFQDTSDRFKLTDCDCQVAYVLDGEVVDTKPLVANSDLDSINSYTFTEPGVYSLEVSGMPKQGIDFQPFKFVYTKRVASGEINAQGMPPLLLAGLTGVAGLILLAAYSSEIGYTERKHKRKGR